MPFSVHNSIIWRRAMILLALCIGLAAIASSEGLHQALLHTLTMTEEVINRHPTTGALLFVALAAASAMFTFVSIAIIVPAVVFAWGEPATLGLLWLGWILGGIGTYGVGRYLGRSVVQWLSTDQTLYRFEHRVRRDTPFWLILLLQLALPSEIPGYVLGLARYPFMRYLLALGLAELPYSVATVRLGGSFLQHRSGLVLAIGISVVILSIGTFYILRHVMHSADKPST